MDKNYNAKCETREIKTNKIKFYKNYNVRCEIREIKNDIQLLVFADDELVFSSKKKSLYVRDYKYQSLKLNKWKLPVFYDVIQPKVSWREPKEKIRFMNMCSNFKRRICLQIQDDVRELFSNYGKLHKIS